MANRDVWLVAAKGLLGYAQGRQARQEQDTLLGFKRRSEEREMAQQERIQRAADMEHQARLTAMERSRRQSEAQRKFYSAMQSSEFLQNPSAVWPEYESELEYLQPKQVEALFAASPAARAEAKKREDEKAAATQAAAIAMHPVMAERTRVTTRAAEQEREPFRIAEDERTAARQAVAHKREAAKVRYKSPSLNALAGQLARDPEVALEREGEFDEGSPLRQQWIDTAISEGLTPQEAEYEVAQMAESLLPALENAIIRREEKIREAGYEPDVMYAAPNSRPGDVGRKFPIIGTLGEKPSFKVVVGGDGKLYAIDPKTGQPLNEQTTIIRGEALLRRLTKRSAR